jgi:hypothetical protein
MTETNEPLVAAQGQPLPPPPPPAAPLAPAYGGLPVAPGAAPIGQIRSTGMCILLTIVTLGIYTLYWYFKTHDEMKAHSGTGLGGGIALLLGFVISPVMVFLTPHEVGGLYQRRGQPQPVSAITGLWILLPLVGSIVWFVKTNGALNAYWRSLGAQG